MKIQVGIGTREEFDYFLRAGADEFYCGFKNIPGHLYGGENFESVQAIGSAIKTAHNNGKKFFLAANEIQSCGLDETVAFIEQMADSGIDGVIIRDIAILSKLRRRKSPFEYILTSLAPCYNEATLGFYKDLGITRLALTEQLLPGEAEALIRNKWGIGTEVFLMASEYCVVLNGLCYLRQFNGDCLCRKELKTASGLPFVMARPTEKEHFANLYDFHKLGVPVLKIGRHPAKDYSKILFSEAVGIKKLLDTAPSKNDFVKKALRYHGKIEAFIKNAQ